MDKSAVVDSCLELLNSASHVKLEIDQELIERRASELKNEIKSFDPFIQWKQNELNPQIFDDHAINWIFLCDLLNFSFWKDEGENESFYVNFDGKDYDGYWSLPATLNKFSFLVNPKCYSKMTLELFDATFNPNIPLKNERISLMQQAGQVLMTKYNGSFTNFIHQFNSSNLDSWSFIDKLLQEFPSFRDSYNGTWFLKRAQILVADLWAASNGKLFSSSIDQLTIFADYRIPQVLSSMNLIKYNSTLQTKLMNRELVTIEEESEIRAASIIACEKLKEAMNYSCNSVTLDYYLWEYSQKIKKEINETFPFHRVRSIYY